MRKLLCTQSDLTSTHSYNTFELEVLFSEKNGDANF